ncbi:MAG: hypothetical protein D6781_10710 [Verrucomicrobia bacterium]|nr:MAG: hypothetical protein D6781_10710 [Verrucomicrobiota bacterium]
MAYDLQVIPRDGYLHFRVTGENTPENLAGYLTESLQHAVEAGCPYALVEEHLTGPELSLETVREIIDELQFAARQHLKAFAFVNTNPEHSGDLTRFAENLAAMRNINMRVFRSVPEAEAWIRFVSGGDREASG